MDKSTVKPHNSINISDDVVSTIVSESVKEIAGVYALSNIPVKIGVMASPSIIKPIKVTLNAETVQIDVGVIVDIGYKIKDVAEQIQKNVKSAVQNMTAIAVSKVNVFVTSVHIPDNKINKK